MGLEWIHVTVDPLIVFVIGPATDWVIPSGVGGPYSTVQIKNTCKFLCTIADSFAMGVNFFVHVFGVGLFISTAGQLWGLGVILLILVMRWKVIFSGWRFAVKSLFVCFLILNFVNDLVGADLNFFKDGVLVGLGLYFYGLIDHITELSISVIKLFISFD